jgi:hypothetical protein
MAGRILIALVCLFGLAAGTAQAGTLSAGPDGTKVYSEPEGLVTQNAVDIIHSGVHYIRDNNAPITVASGSGCDKEGTTQPPGTYIICSSVTGFVISLGGGNDTLNKTIPCCPATVPLLIDGGVGADALVGGASSADFVTYQGRSLGVSVDVGAPGKDDGSSEDGPVGARDEIAAEIEGAIGGAGLDILEAGSLPVTLRGGGGEDELLGGEAEDLLEGGPEGDRLNGRGGSDVVRGDAGVDNVEARDGVFDDVDCGPDEDSALTDPIDSRVGCDPPPASPPPAVAQPLAVSSLLLDRVAPETAIKRKPPKQTQKRRVSFAFAATEPGSRFECKLDKRPYRSCGASASFGGLKPGRHLLLVRAVDAAGNVDFTPASYRFKVLPKPQS